MIILESEIILPPMHRNVIRGIGRPEYYLLPSESNLIERLIATEECATGHGKKFARMNFDSRVNSRMNETGDNLPGIILAPAIEL